jgi:hypothetical protein
MKKYDVTRIRSSSTIYYLWLIQKVRIKAMAKSEYKTFHNLFDSYNNLQ